MAVRKGHTKRSKHRAKASKKSLAAMEHKGLKRHHRRKTSRVRKRKSHRGKKR